MKTTVKIALSVEGDTEKLYFDWLQEQINSDKSALKHIIIDSKVNQSPSSRAKMLPNFSSNYPILAHVCDVESKDDEHVTKFQNIITQLEEARKRFDNYKFFYSNFTFDLWMILHKATCNGALTHRKHYLDKINKAYKMDFISLDTYKEKNQFAKCLSKLTLQDVRDAVQRAKQICKIYNQNGNKFKNFKGIIYAEENPYLTVGDLVEYILKLCY